MYFNAAILSKKKVHDEDCTGWEHCGSGYKYCDCKHNSKYSTFTSKFSWMNKEGNVILSSIRIFSIHPYDRTNLLLFVDILTYAEISGENIIAGLEKKAIQFNDRLLYNNEIVTLHLKSSRNHDSEIDYDIKNSMITFNLRDNQCCDNCSCGDCQYYSRIINQEKTTIVLNDGTKDKIIEMLRQVIPKKQLSQHWLRASIPSFEKKVVTLNKEKKRKRNAKM